MTLQFHQESEDVYWVSWEDTLGADEGYHKDSMKFIKRPKEIWCVITSAENDTLGWYEGSSMARTYAGFYTTDSIVVLNFMTGLNLFPDKEVEDKKERRKYPVRYEPVIFNFRSNMNREIELELKEI